MELQRIAQNWPFWVGVLALAILSWSNMVLVAPSSGQGLFGSFSYYAIDDSFVFLIPVFVGSTVAGSLAADRRRGYPSLVLVRGLSRVRYLFAKAAAMAIAAFSGIFTSCVLAFLGATVFLPWGPTQAPGSMDWGSMGPYPNLLATHPLINDLVLSALLSLGAGAIALSGLAFGAIIANEYVVAAVPFVLLIGGIFVLRGPLLFLGPYTQLSLTSSYPISLSQWAWPFAAPVYWSVFGAACVAVAAAVFLKKEEV